VGGYIDPSQRDWDHCPFILLGFPLFPLFSALPLGGGKSPCPQRPVPYLAPSARKASCVWERCIDDIDRHP
jgi:hypothetical protein